MSLEISPKDDEQIRNATWSITTYGGLVLFIMGLVDNTLNIVSFTCLKTYRTLSTSVFLTTASIFGQIYLTFSLLMASLSNILGYNPSAKSASLCRAGLLIIRGTLQIYLTSLCFCAIDRFSMTSRSARQRSLVTRRRSLIATMINIVFWSVYAIPNGLFIINSPFFNLCIPSIEFSKIITYLNLVFSVVLPVSILTIFGLLTWRNLKVTRVSAMNVQITRMILLDIIVVAISNIPIGCFFIYAITRSADRLFTPTEAFLIYFTQLLSSIQASGSFYFYLLVSSAFRKNIRMMCLNFFCCGRIIQPVAVVPMSSAATPMNRNSMPPIGH